MADELTVRDRKFVKGIVSGKKKYKAAQDAGFSTKNPKAASVTAARKLDTPRIQRAIDAALAAKGLDEKRVAEVLEEGLQANKVISATVVGKAKPVADPAVDEVEANERTMDFIDVPDHPTRHKYLETLVDIMGVKAPKEAKISVTKTIEDLLPDDDAEEDSEVPEAR